MNTLRVIMVMAALCALRPATASAQERVWGQDKGFSLGLQLVVDGLGSDNSADSTQPHIDDMGAGLALVGGYTFSPHFHARVTLGSAQHGTSVSNLDVQHAFASIEAHYRFMPDRQVSPYVFGSFGGTDVRADQGVNHVKFSGSTAGLGAGLLCGFSPRWGVDMSLRFEAVNWNKAEWSQDQPGGGALQYQASLEDSGGSMRLHVGVGYAF